MVDISILIRVYKPIYNWGAPHYVYIYIHIHIYTYIWVNYNDLTATSLEIMFNKGNPQMAELFRLVKYFYLPRYIYIYGLLWYKTMTMLGKIKQKHVDFTTIAIHVDTTNAIHVDNLYIYMYKM